MSFIELGNRLKSVRMGLNLSQMDFAKKLEITDKTLRNYENGKNITVDFVKKVSDLTNTDFYYLLNGNSEINKTNLSKNKFQTDQNSIILDTSIFNHQEDIKEIINLLQYAPSAFLTNIKNKLYKFKEESNLD